jgi:hypothetical protein
MNTADTVLHRPTGETWTVAYVHGDELCPCGWPETIAQVSDCELVKSATEEERDDLLHELSQMAEPDSRGRHARWELALRQRRLEEVP